MIYRFSPHLLLRKPVKNPADYNADLQTFLDDPLFLSAIYLASPVFYNSLERFNFNNSSLSAKERITLQKYVNRYCFRPTPFGLFSAVSLIKWGIEPSIKIKTPKFQAHISASMPFQRILSDHFTARIPDEKILLEANPSIYRILNEYRFFRTGLNESGKQRDYQLQSIAFSKILKDLISLATVPRLKKGLSAQISLSAGCTSEEADDYINFLIDSQLLITNTGINISGKDYPKRLLELTSSPKLSAHYQQFLNSSSDQTPPLTPAGLQHMEDQLTGLLPFNIDLSEKLSIILTSQDSSYSLEAGAQQKLRDGIDALELLTPTGQGANMSQFIIGFQKHFEGQTLPLLQALDPEAGVGYQQPENEKNNPLLETLLIPYRGQPAGNSGWSPAHSIIMEAWLRESGNTNIIRLQRSDLESLRSENSDSPFLGMSVLFRTAGEKIFIENAGGINAPALMGRFTVAGDDIAEAARTMAAQLEALNPDIIFAELLHLADPHIDNVNRRAHIYHYELPITATSTLPRQRQLRLAELYVKVANNQVYLYSEAHQKIVIPRLTSAYNHGLNKLPLFRFLADLSYQYGRSGLGVDLRQLFPNLHFYPRVEYEDTILSLATWVINEVRLEAFQTSDNELTERFATLKSKLNLPRYFSLAEGDQELVFDGDRPADIEFFASCIRQKKEVILKEFIFRESIAQFNAYLLPEIPLLLPVLTGQPEVSPKSQRKYIPGSQWLYLKIYAPRIGVNRLLLQLRPLLKKSYNGHKITQWFFIRYEDHAPHIRLRLQVNPGSINEILLAFKNKLEDRIQQHVIREFQLDVYNRELERYAAGGIDNTERFFWASSELTLNFLKHGKFNPAISTHTFALCSTQTIITTFVEDLDRQIAFTLESFQQFLPEFSSKNIKVELDKKYRELAPGINKAFGINDPAFLSGSEKAGRIYLKSLQTVKKHWQKNSDPGYIRSLIHMHLNRIFTDEARKQEMICYYLLNKYLVSLKARNKNSVNN